MYPIQYLRKDTTTRVPNPGPTAKLVGTMAQDLIKKKKERSNQIRRTEYTLWVDPCTTKVRSSLKKKTDPHWREKSRVVFKSEK